MKRLSEILSGGSLVAENEQEERTPEEEVNEVFKLIEVLTPSQRQKRRRIMKNPSTQAKIKKARKKSAKRKQPPAVIKKRSIIKARKLLYLKLSKGRPPSEISPAEKFAMELKIAKKKKVIMRIAKKLYPMMIQKEKQRSLG